MRVGPRPSGRVNGHAGESRVQSAARVPLPAQKPEMRKKKNNSSLVPCVASWGKLPCKLVVTRARAPARAACGWAVISKCTLEWEMNTDA